QGFYDTAMDFSLSQLNDKRAVFQYLESSRARSLFDLISADRVVLENKAEMDVLIRSVSTPFTLEQTQRGLPPDTQLLAYAVLEDKLLICRVTHDDYDVIPVPVGREALATLADEFRRAMINKGDNVTELARRIHDLLIAPVESTLPSKKHIVVIPDKMLTQTPFQALMSRAAGKYVMEQYDLMLAPSATIFLQCTENAKKRAAKVERLFAVGNPVFDSGRYKLPALPKAAEEVQAIARLYQGVPSIALTGPDARKEAVIQRLPEADVAHLATHYVTADRAPLRSRLLLARAASPDAGEDTDVLRADQIYRLSLKRTRLVVLSACDSGVEGYINGEGMQGLSRVFLAAGVPLVIGSQWLADSAATSDLMIAFHKYRKEGGLKTGAALRRAQLDLYLNRPEYRHPYYWANFSLIGGRADY
ncbi:MAG: CHAT domain-containing protein, partial [Blastocatellia bacterium]